MSAFLCSLTNHEVYYNAVYTQRKDSHRNEINEHLGQEEDGNTIVATHILTTGRLSRENRYMYLKVTITFFCDFGLKHLLQVLNFAIHTQK